MEGFLPKATRVWFALLIAALGGGGCASWRWPQIDQSGQHIFVPRDAGTSPGNQALGSVSVRQPCISISPGQIIAPVGSEVVMTAGVCSTSGSLSANERVEWMISPESVGEFVTIGDRGCLSLFRCPTNTPRKVTNNYAIGATLNSSLNITRGTLTPNDDVTVGRGQSWITVSSPSEGTTQVTAFAPNVESWNLRKATGTIHWIDAQWTFPPPAVNPLGENHVFTTTLTRRDGTPIAGWRVRYEILDGPPAGFGPAGEPAIEVPTDPAGQASVELVQKQAMGGTNRIGIQIIRPATIGPNRSPQLILGSGSTTKTWTAPQLSLRITAPSQATIGSTLSYRVEVVNTGDLPSRGVVLTDDIPPGLTFQSSNPAAQPVGRKLEFQLGDIAPRQSQVVEMNFRADAAGTYNHCASLRSSEGLAASQCATTTVGAANVEAAQLEVRMTGPATQPVGSWAKFDISVTNRGSAPATGLQIKASFDDALVRPNETSPIIKPLAELPAGATQNIALTLQIVKPGRACSRVEVTAAGNLRGQAEACLNATPAPAGEAAPPAEGGPALADPAPKTKPEPKAAPAGQPALEVRVSAPAEGKLDDFVTFDINIVNTGEVPLTQVKAVTQFDPELKIEAATDGFDKDRFENEITYTLPKLDVGATKRIQIKCRCAAPAARACARVTIESDQTGPRADMACTSIPEPAVPAKPPAFVPKEKPPAIPDEKPAPKGVPNARSNVKLTMTDLVDAVRVGNETSYRVFITNEGEASEKGLMLAIEFPPELTPIEVAPTVEKLDIKVEGNVIKIGPYAELRAGRSVTYTIRMKANRAGMVAVKATLTGDTLTQPLSTSEQTRIEP